VAADGASSCAERSASRRSPPRAGRGDPGARRMLSLSNRSAVSGFAVATSAAMHSSRFMSGTGERKNSRLRRVRASGDRETQRVAPERHDLAGARHSGRRRDIRACSPLPERRHAGKYAGQPASLLLDELAEVWSWVNDPQRRTTWLAPETAFQGIDLRSVPLRYAALISGSLRCTRNKAQEVRLGSVAPTVCLTASRSVRRSGRSRRRRAGAQRARAAAP
jgi:hypothetical protein